MAKDSYDYTIKITMDQTTADTLQNGKYRLYGFKAIAGQPKQDAMPLV
ncbi:hypothetical protein ACFVFQ_31480 [Streptomyces sp. NPDC057743]